MLIETAVMPLRKAMSTNSTATSFTAKIPVAVEPTSSSGYHNLVNGEGGSVGSYIMVIPFGTDANNETFDMRIWGWTFCPAMGDWIPSLLQQTACTLGNIDAAAIGANHFLCDTLVRAAGDPTPRYTSPASEAVAVNDIPGCFELDIKGFQAIEFDFDLTGAAACNALWRTF